MQSAAERFSMWLRQEDYFKVISYHALEGDYAGRSLIFIDEVDEILGH